MALDTVSYLRIKKKNNNYKLKRSYNSMVLQFAVIVYRQYICKCYCIFIQEVRIIHLFKFDVLVGKNIYKTLVIRNILLVSCYTLVDIQNVNAKSF